MVWGSFLIAAALKTPKRNVYNAHGVNLNFRLFCVDADDGAKIITSVVRQFAGATMCWLANATALEAALALPGVDLAYHCRVGGVEAFVLRTRRV